MIEVSPRLYVGSAEDYESEVAGKPGWFVVQACKDPYHRQALGYTGRGAPTDHAEYLLARRGNRLILNMVDADKPEFFRDEMIDPALAFVWHNIRQGHKVLIHCNQGLSRAPGLALLHLRLSGAALPAGFDEAEVAFKERIYPPYEPKEGIRGYVRMRWGRAEAKAAKSPERPARSW